jgi:phthalate 4,5-cis-dihydrodiol dehydrogenase
MTIDVATTSFTRPAAATATRPGPPVRVGVVGAGEQASNHLLPALLRIPAARVTALVDPDTSRRDELADQLNIRHRLDTIEQVLDSGHIDCIVAACPPQAHERIAAAAIQARVPVFVEKPPATSSTALTDLANAAAANDVLTGVGMNFRWAAPVRRLATMLREGRHGTPAVLTIRHVASKPTSSLWNLPLWQSFLLAQAIHPIDLLTTLAGGDVVDTQAACRHTPDGITIALQLHYGNGAIGTLICGNQAPRFEHRLEVTTTGGLTACLTSLTELTITALAGPGERGASTQWRPSPLDVGYERTGFGGELAAFCHAVATGATFTPGLSDLLSTYQIMDQLTPAAGSR